MPGNPGSGFDQALWLGVLTLCAVIFVLALWRKRRDALTTPRDLLVFDADGQPIQNSLRRPDECVRHKILDCLGDFALAGARLSGSFSAERTGHRHNHELIRHIKQTQLGERRRVA